MVEDLAKIIFLEEQEEQEVVEMETQEVMVQVELVLQTQDQVEGGHTMLMVELVEKEL